MSRPDRDMEIIELLPADDAPGAWSRQTGPATTAVAPRGRRTAVFGSLAVIAAVVAVAVIASGSDDSADPSPTTSNVPGFVVTSPPPLTPDEPVADGVFVLDDPSLRPYAADIASPPDVREAFWLWTSSTTTAVMGVDLTPTPAANVFFVDAIRRTVAGLELVSPRRDPDTTHVVIDRGEVGSATVTTTNMSDEQIVDVVKGLVINDAASIVDDSPVLADLGLRHTATARTRQELLQGTIQTESRYLDAAGGMITLAVGEPVGVASAATLLSAFSDDVATTDAGRVVGTLRGSEQALVVWESDGHVLSLTASLAPLQLLDLATKVRGGSETEWRGLVAALHPDFVLGRYSVLARGGSDVDEWRAGVQLASRGGRPQLLAWWTVPGTPDANDSVLLGDPTRGTNVSYVVVSGTTYVFVSRPATLDNDTAQVTGADGRSVVVQMQQPFADQPVLVGVVRIDASGPIAVTT